MCLQLLASNKNLLHLQNDSEKEKMRSALGSAIMMEKPNVKVLIPPFPEDSVQALSNCIHRNLILLSCAAAVYYPHFASQDPMPWH